MAGQAGWYRAPGEEGLLRYWNGGAWTEHRQSAPTEVPPPAPQEPAVATEPFAMPVAQRHLATEPLVPQSPDPIAEVKATERDWSMDQFEAQFSSSLSLLAPADFSSGTDLPSGAEPSTPTDLTGFSGSVASPVDSASRFAPQQDAPGSTQVQVTSAPVATATQTTNPGAATPPAKPSAVDIAFAASTATAKVTNGRRNRKRVLSSVRGMIVGLIFVLVGAALIFMAAAQNSPPSGQLRAAGIITSLGHPVAGCAPVARFAAAGGSYTAKSAPFAPCPVQLGESVNVFYSPKHPGSTGFISVPSSISTIDWAVTGIGVVLLVGSAIVFFIRAGSISRAAAVVRAGDERELARSVSHP